MNAIKEHFYTNWHAMTLHDWLGLAITIVVFFFMIALYVYVFHPSNKEKLESQRFIPLDDDDSTYMDSHPGTYRKERENTP